MKKYHFVAILSGSLLGTLAGRLDYSLIQGIIFIVVGSFINALIYDNLKD